MSTEIKVPVFPESVEEGTMMAWLKQPGEAIGVDEKVAEVETDKVVLDVIAAQPGVLEQILKAEGETVQGGEVIGMIGEGDGVVAAPKPAPKAPEPEPEPAPAPEPKKPEPAPAPPPAPPEAAVERGESAIGPAARKLIQERGIDPSLVNGSGRDGRVTKTDVLNYIAVQEERKAGATSVADVPKPPPAAPRPTPATLHRHEERIPMTRLRARIAERLVEAQQTAAILTTFNEVDMKPVMDLRSKYKADFEKTHGVRLGFMSFFIKAAIEALKRFPSVNGSIEGQDIIHHHYYDIGVAVSSPRGLVVPVLRDADTMSFAEIEAGVRELGTKASENRLSMDDLQGGTFTISNGGVFGSMLSTPILNPPQSAILGMHAITERPVAVNGQVEVRPVMYLALSYDHRIIDGREAVSSLVTIKEALEDPARLLLQV